MRLIFSFILLFPFVLSAQDRTIDSLKLALKNAKHDTMRLKIRAEIGEIGMILRISYWDSIVIDAQRGVLLPTSLNTHKVCYLKQLTFALNNIGYIYNCQGNIPKALEYYRRSLKIREEIKDKKGIATSLNNFGEIYDNQGDIPKALGYYHRCLKISEDIMDHAGISAASNNIGTIYDNLGDISKALKYYDLALKNCEEIKDKRGIGITLNNIGCIYEKKDDVHKALEYYNRSLKIQLEISNKYGVAYALNNIGDIYSKQAGDIAKALEFYQKCLILGEELNDKYGIAISLNKIGLLLNKQGKTSEALSYANRSILLAKELGFPENIRNAAGTLKQIYKKQNKFKESLDMYELEIQMRDSINNTETKKASIKKQFQYEYEKKAAADSVKHTEEQKVKNALLTAQQAQLKQEKTQRLALYGGLVLVIAFSGFVFNRFRVTQKQKVIIEHQKVLVDDAFAHLEEKNKEVMDSIRYAKRIQTALLTSEKYIERKLNELIS